MEIPDLKQKYIVNRAQIIVITIEIFNIYKCSTFSLCSLKYEKENEKPIQVTFAY